MRTYKAAKQPEPTPAETWLAEYEDIVRGIIAFDALRLSLWDPTNFLAMETDDASGLLVRRRKDEVFLSFVGDLFGDDVLTGDEIVRLGDIGRALYGTAEASVAIWWPTYGGLYQLSKLHDGPLVPIEEPTLMLGAGETQYLNEHAVLLGEERGQSFLAASPGVSIKLGGGLRVRLNAYAGQTKRMPPEVVVEDEGDLAVTSARVVFVGRRRTVELPLSRLLALNLFTDGIAIHSHGQKAPSSFRVASGSLVATLITRLLDMNDGSL